MTATTNRPAKKYRVNREKVRRAQIVQTLPGYAVNTDPLFNPREAGAYISITEKTLSKWRTQYPDRLPYHKVGGSIRYRKSTLDTFLNACLVTDGSGVKK